MFQKAYYIVIFSIACMILLYLSGAKYIYAYKAYCAKHKIAIDEAINVLNVEEKYFTLLTREEQEDIYRTVMIRVYLLLSGLLIVTLLGPKTKSNSENSCVKIDVFGKEYSISLFPNTVDPESPPSEGMKKESESKSPSSGSGETNR